MRQRKEWNLIRWKRMWVDGKGYRSNGGGDECNAK